MVSTTFVAISCYTSLKHISNISQTSLKHLSNISQISFQFSFKSHRVWNLESENFLEKMGTFSIALLCIGLDFTYPAMLLYFIWDSTYHHNHSFHIKKLTRWSKSLGCWAARLAATVPPSPSPAFTMVTIKMFQFSGLGVIRCGKTVVMPNSIDYHCGHYQLTRSFWFFSFSIAYLFVILRKWGFVS